MAKQVKIEDEVWTEDQFNKRIDEAYLLGKATGFGDAVGLASQESGVYFAARKDEAAKQWRAFADFLSQHHKRCVADYEKAKKESEESRNNT